MLLLVVFFSVACYATSSSSYLPDNCICTNLSSVLFVNRKDVELEADRIATQCRNTSCVYKECFYKYSVYSGNYMINKCFDFVDLNWNSHPYQHGLCARYRIFHSNFTSSRITDISTYHYISILTLIVCLSIVLTLCVSIVSGVRKRVLEKKRGEQVSLSRLA